jgi:hypothetical protein
MKIINHFLYLTFLYSQLYGPTEESVHVQYVLNCSKLCTSGTSTKTVLVVSVQVGGPNHIML